MSKIIDIDLRTKEQKRAEFKEKAKDKIRNGYEWVKDNKKEAIGIVTLLATATTTVVKTVGKRSNLAKQESIKNLYCYDRSLGHYWKLRRELTNQEWLEIDRRKRAGERLADILSELKVLK